MDADAFDFGFHFSGPGPLSNSMADGGTNRRHERSGSSSTSSRNGSTRAALGSDRIGPRNGHGARLTCDHCRERKVKCTKTLPKCSRCSRLGLECVYRDRMKHRANQAAVIKHLQERVDEAEARLALQLTSSSYRGSGEAVLAPGEAGLGSVAGPSLETLGDAGPYDGSWASFQVHEFDFASLDASSVGHGFSQPPSTPTELESNAPSRWFPDAANPPLAPESTPLMVSQEDLARLHRIFFESFDPAMPIVARDRFLRDVEVRSGPSISGLSYAAALLAITVSESHSHLAKPCYALARRYIDECEGECDESWDPLASLSLLQALVLLTRFEINNRACARAWLSLGRAARLARMMRLDQMDRSVGGPSSVDGTLPHVPLPATQDLGELEERRRCFWALYILEGHASIHSGNLGSLEDTKLFVWLPSPGPLDQTFDPSPMPYLTEVTLVSSPDLLTPFSGIVLVVSMMRRVQEHASLTETNGAQPGFWDRHYSLIKLFDAHEALLKSLCAMRTLLHDALAYNLYLTLLAAELRLYEVAVAEGRRQGLPPSVAAENAKNAHACALKIATTVRTTWSRQRSFVDNLSLSGAYVAWPLCMAIKTLSDEARVPEEQMACSNLIQMLHEALDDVERPGGRWHQSVSLPASPTRQRDGGSTFSGGRIRPLRSSDTSVKSRGCQDKGGGEVR